MKKQNNDYAEQYKNPKWQKLRLKILERDNWACQKCGDDESQLQVHHRKYVYGKKIWEYKLNELVTLCDECHKEEKENMKKCIEQLNETLKISFFSGEIFELNYLISYALYISKYPPEVLISSLSWIISNKLEDNVIQPYFKHISSRHLKTNG